MTMTIGYSSRFPTIIVTKAGGGKMTVIFPYFSIFFSIFLSSKLNIYNSYNHNEKEKGNLHSFTNLYAKPLGSAMLDGRGAIAHFSVGSQNLLHLLGSHGFPETTLDRGGTSPRKWGSGSRISESSAGDSVAY